MNSFETYYDFMDKYEKFYKKVRDEEENKLNTLLSNDIKKIEAVLFSYQKYVTEIQHYEEKRIELCEKLGFKGTSFADIIENFDGEERKKLTEQKQRLENLVNNVSYMNKKSLEIADIQLKFVQEIAEHSPENSKSYNAKGESEAPLRNSNLLNKTI